MVGKKICSKCDKLLPLSAFKLRGDRACLRAMCRECVKQYDRDHYFSNRIKKLKRKKETRKAIYARNKSFVRNFLKYKACEVCGETDSIVLEFHHVDRRNKLHNITDMMHYSTNAIEKEMLKCDVLCANCHRRLHYYNRLEE